MTKRLCSLLQLTVAYYCGLILLLVVSYSSWLYLILGCWVHGPAGGGGLAEAGADQGGEACTQLHDGHTAHQTGKVKEDHTLCY